jgi:hypothetical protein
MALAATGVAQTTRGRSIDVRAGGEALVPPNLPGPLEPPDSSTTTQPGRPALIVWAEAGDIWLYEAGTGERRSLTDDGEARFEYLPRFHGPGRVTFVAADDRPANDFRPGATSHRSVIREIDLSTGRTRELASLEGGVAAHDWSPDGTTLAVYLSGGDHTASELHLITGDRRTVIRRFAPVWGRGGYVNYDEWRVE